MMHGEDTRIVNLRHGPPPDGAVYVGRGSRWGNPFRIGVDGTREEVIEKYRQYILKRPYLLAHLEELRGKVLACWCAPLPCHAEVLVELANQSEPQP